MGRTSEETSLSLVWLENFGIGHLDREHAGEALAGVVAGDLDLFLFGDAGFAGVLVDDARERAAEAGKVRAAVALRDVVGEAEDVLVVAVIPLQRGLDDDAVLLGLDVDRLGDQRGALLVDVADEGFDAALVLQHDLPTARGRAGPVKTILTPELRKASSRRRCSSVSRLNSVMVKVVGAGRKRTVVPVSTSCRRPSSAHRR